MRRITHRAVIVAASAITVLACSDTTKPIVEIANAPIAINWGTAEVSSGGRFFLGAVDSLGHLQPLFDTLAISGSGNYTMRAGDAGFAQKTAWLNNGQPNAVRYGVVLTPSGTEDAFNSFDFILLGVNPDLSPHTLSSVSLEVDSASVASPGSDPNHDGNWTDVRFFAHVVVFGDSL
jgi:hypothetical protein